jgi:hypothetical protein
MAPEADEYNNLIILWSTSTSELWIRIASWTVMGYIRRYRPGAKGASLVFFLR